MFALSQHHGGLMLKANPKTTSEKKNDYCQHFVNTGERPQNFIRDIRPEQRFAGALLLIK